MLHDELGRRDLAKKGVIALRKQLLPEGLFDRAFVEAAMLSMGEPVDTAFVLESAALLPDLWARTGMLCLAASGCEPLRVLPLLNMSLAMTHERGAHGLWLALQVRLAGVLYAAGRAREAAEAAHAAWRRIEGGVTGLETLPAMAALLCPPLAAAGSAESGVIALRALAWMQAAASTLPAGWRDNYLARAPALAGMGSARARLGSA